MQIGKKNDNTPLHLYKDEESGRVKVTLQQISKEKDLGIITDSNLNFNQHIHDAVNKANRLMGTIRRTYTYLDNKTFCLLYKALVRPHLEYGACVWNPYLQKDINELENVQRRATKQIPGMKDLSYENRLRILKLPSLRHRRLRGDMIQVYKLTHGGYDSAVSEGLLVPNINKITRGHSLSLLKRRSRLNLRKYSFSERVVNFWNSLPDAVVTSPTVKTFESRLDKHWSNSDCIYNHEIDNNILIHLRET